MTPLLTLLKAPVYYVNVGEICTKPNDLNQLALNTHHKYQCPRL